MRLLRSAVVPLVVAGGLAVSQGPALAEPPPYEETPLVSQITAIQNGSANLVTALGVGFVLPDGGKPLPDTIVELSAYSCGNFLQTSTTTLEEGEDKAGVWFSPNGKPTFEKNAVNRRVGRSIQFEATVTVPGYDPVTTNHSYDGYSVKRPSCKKLNSACRITRKPKKVGAAQVGTTVRVRPPKTTGGCGRTTYTWKANGKVIERGKSLRVGSKLRGQRLVVTVKPAQANTVTLRFGRVR